MKKVISFINVTLDGFCDHTAMIADDELHQNANALLSITDTILFGRITYQLMEEGWPPIVKNPTGNKPTDEFAVLIEMVSKLVFSHTLERVDWKNARLARQDIKEEVMQLRQSPGDAGKIILVGSPSLIITLMQLVLIDEYRFCVHPVILGKGLPLFRNIKEQINLTLIQTQRHQSGAVTVYYEPAEKEKRN